MVKAFDFIFIISEVIIIVLYLLFTDYSEGVSTADTTTVA